VVLVRDNPIVPVTGGDAYRNVRISLSLSSESLFSPFPNDDSLEEDLHFPSMKPYVCFCFLLQSKRQFLEQVSGQFDIGIRRLVEFRLVGRQQFLALRF